jgi:hypothetical protein
MRNGTRGMRYLKPLLNCSREYWFADANSTNTIEVNTSHRRSSLGSTSDSAGYRDDGTSASRRSGAHVYSPNDGSNRFM